MEVKILTEYKIETTKKSEVSKPISGLKAFLEDYRYPIDSSELLQEIIEEYIWEFLDNELILEEDLEKYNEHSLEPEITNIKELAEHFKYLIVEEVCCNKYNSTYCPECGKKIN